MPHVPLPDEHAHRYTRIREVLKRLEGDLQYAIRQVDEALDAKSEKWKCVACGHVRHLTRPVPRSAVGKCSRCGKTEYQEG